MSNGRLLVAWLTLLVVGTDLFVVSPMLRPWSRQFHTGVDTVGLAVTGFSVAYVMSAPLVGGWADRRGRRPALSAALGMFATANALTALATGTGMLIVVRVLAGLSAAGITPNVFALVGGSAEPSRRAFALGVTTSGLLSALWLGAPAGELLTGWIGWRAVFGALAGIAVIMLVLGRSCWREDRPTATTLDGGATSALGTRMAAVAPTLLWAVAVYGVYTYLSSGLHDNERWSGAAVGGALATYGVCAVVSSVAGGRIADIWPPRVVVLAALAGTAVALALLGTVASAPTPVVLVALGLFSLAAYLVFPAQQAGLLRRFDQERSAMLAWNQSAMYVGIAVGSAGGGLVMAHLGFRVLPYCAAVAALVGAFTVRWVHDTVPGPVSRDSKA